jgi:hypothetical protein
VFQKELYYGIPNVTVWRVLRKRFALKGVQTEALLKHPVFTYNIMGLVYFKESMSFQGLYFDDEFTEISRLLDLFFPLSILHFHPVSPLSLSLAVSLSALPLFSVLLEPSSSRQYWLHPVGKVGRSVAAITAISSQL